MRDASAECIGHRRSSPNRDPVVARQSRDGRTPPADDFFCDLVGSTALASRLDPEDWRDVVNDYHDCAQQLVEQHKGYVAQYLGDGILVYFGYPEAKEDDAERAVRAGLDLVRAVPNLVMHHVKLNARVGIATGPTIIGDLISSGSARERSALGETPNLAARLQATAEPGTVIISPLTRRCVGELFDYKELGSLELKGFSQTIRATQVIAERRLDSRFEGLHPTRQPMIGRATEANILYRSWGLASLGRGQVVLISGEPGIGKSRLVAELEEYLTAIPHLRLRFMCSPQHSGSALHPVIDQIERLAGFAYNDTIEKKISKFEALLQDAPTTIEDISLIKELLSLPTTASDVPQMNPQERRNRTFEAIIRQLKERASVLPVLIIWDDVHWIDATSQALLDQLVEQVSGIPILCVITSRPEFVPAWPLLSHITSLPLERLSDSEISTLTSQVAGGRQLPSELIEKITSRTDGVPLFAEELTKNLLESGLLKPTSDLYELIGPLPADVVPSTLQASILARLDRLSSSREIAQVASAIRSRIFARAFVGGDGRRRHSSCPEPRASVGSWTDRASDAASGRALRVQARPYARRCILNAYPQELTGHPRRNCFCAGRTLSPHGTAAARIACATLRER